MSIQTDRFIAVNKLRNLALQLLQILLGSLLEDNAEGPDHEWRVVHVEFRCTNGTEHIIAGLPKTWDPRLCLGVLVKGQIG